jgi:hypothetical protein
VWEYVDDVKVPCASSTMMADEIVFPDAGRSGVLK